jgi:hypothetical protein
MTFNTCTCVNSGRSHTNCVHTLATNIHTHTHVRMCACTLFALTSSACTRAYRSACAHNRCVVIDEYKRVRMRELMNCVSDECVCVCVRVCAHLVAAALSCQYACTCILIQSYTPIVCLTVTVDDVANVVDTRSLRCPTDCTLISHEHQYITM